MKDFRSDDHSVAGVFVFLLLGLFAVCALVLTLFGAQAYRNSVRLVGEHGDARVLRSYVRNAVRADDAEGCVRVLGDDVLAIYPLEDEGEYVKYIYVSDGMLKELYTETEWEFDGTGGEEIAAAESLRVTAENGLLHAVITDLSGAEYVSDIAVRTAQ